MLIGISANYTEQTYRIAQQYADCITRLGACAVILPVTNDKNIIQQYIHNIDGLLLTGGGDMDPKFWGETPIEGSDLSPLVRDIYDLELYHTARRHCIPIMGICRGMQLICIAEGGSLHQDIHQCYDPKALNHSPKIEKHLTAHPIKSLHPFFNNITAANSIHHQSINFLPSIFTLGAVAPDGVIEAFIAEHYPIFGVQWHPEHLAEENEEHNTLFQELIRLSNIYNTAKQIHKTSPVVDSHTDTPMAWSQDTDMRLWQEDMKVDFAKMRTSNIAAAFMVAYISQQTLPREAFSTANEILQRLTKQVEVSEHTRIALSATEVHKNHSNNIQSVILAIENGLALCGDINNIDHFYDMGVRYITLCHNGDNDICDSCNASQQTHGGLSSFGKQVIEKMNQLGIIVDISHAAETTMQQAIAYSTSPVIASHSGAYTLCQHPRNISDDTLLMLAKKGGVCQICLYDGFLNNDSNTASINDILSHIVYLKELIGIDHIGIGSDFDGGGGISGCQSENELINITMRLINEGFSSDEIAKVMGGNILRLWQEIQDNNNN